MSDHDPTNELADSASRSMLGPNPFIGIRTEDVLATAGALTKEAAAHPLLVLEQQAALVREIALVFAGQSTVKPARDDRRFSDAAWTENPFYRAFLGGYLAWTKSLDEFIDKSSFDARTKERARFVRQLVTDALSPSNSPANPAAVKRAVETGGVSMIEGLRHMTSDMVNNGGMPSMVDKSAFTLGKNLAVTEGSVVFRNDVLELIQYRPQTEQIYAVPLMIVPPQINKYYVFDLSPEKSMVDFLIKGGIGSFVVSWRNPTAAQRDWGMDTYVTALIEAIDAIKEISGSPKVNIAGACAGAMTLSALLGYYAAGRGKNPVNSATLMVAVLDSESESMLTMFMTEDTAKAAKAATKVKGVLDGSEMGRVFAWLRPNDLVWNYWVNNYLLGKNPPAFDILAWNADTTRLPAKFHGEIIDSFVENKFKHPGGMVVLGRPIDLHKVTLDSYIVAGITDHISQWKGVYRTMMMLGGKPTMVLSAAGHIQSLINPPADAAKRQYFLNPDHGEDPEEWLKAASTHKGSWWGHWLAWLEHRSGDKIPAPAQTGSAVHPPIADAPGTYVLEK
ncbi:MAG: alpha/beta fold hydrolase [Candidatus Velthaea sp.]